MFQVLHCTLQEVILYSYSPLACIYNCVLKKCIRYLLPISKRPPEKAFDAWHRKYLRTRFKLFPPLLEKYFNDQSYELFYWDLLLYLLLWLFYCIQNWRFIWVERGQGTLFWQLERYLYSHLCFQDRSCTVFSRTVTSTSKMQTFFFSLLPTQCLLNVTSYVGKQINQYKWKDALIIVALILGKKKKKRKQ